MVQESYLPNKPNTYNFLMNHLYKILIGLPEHKLLLPKFALLILSI